MPRSICCILHHPHRGYSSRIKSLTRAHRAAEWDQLLLLTQAFFFSFFSIMDESNSIIDEPTQKTDSRHVRDIRQGDIALIRSIPVKVLNNTRLSGYKKRSTDAFILEGETVFTKKKMESPQIVGELTMVNCAVNIFKSYDVIGLDGDTIQLKNTETGDERSDLLLEKEDGDTWESGLSRSIRNAVSSGQPLNVTVAEWDSEVKIVAAKPK